MSRYVYLLNTLPASVIERAHEAAFKDVPLERRQEMFEQLRPFMSEEERAQAAEPALLARLVRRAEERRAASGAAASSEAAHARGKADTAVQFAAPDLLTQAGIMPLVAYHFLVSSAVYSYFTVGAGSLGLAGEPAWVTDMVDRGSAGADGGAFGADAGGGFDGGGAYDAGSFPGMDAGSFGGFGGGFDGGGFG
ncbi:MAG TPA: hypothetical protein VNT50_11175 [Microbacterium sp.]|uniref:hypothetical protein n=1 Tax=Microbacterium sp. TaxID=51671 RepID=UPI002C87EF10|nr:hypothetical protein [Microbacterium sp.]HWI32045.1 hypothetical protein [Microbacterium sp.]